MKNGKYSRPNRRSRANEKMGFTKRAYDYADIIIKHLKIRLKEATAELVANSIMLRDERYLEWYERVVKANSQIVANEVAAQNKKRKEPINCFTDEGRAVIGEALLRYYVVKNRETVIDLRRALGYEYSRYSYDNVILTNGIENSDVFRLFGSPLTFEELKYNYKQLSKELHPDIGGDAEAFGMVNKLYEVIVAQWEYVKPAEREGAMGQGWDPANLAIDAKDLKAVMAKKFNNETLVALLSKSCG